MKYCTNCGIVLEWKKVEQIYRLFCPRCQCIYYDRLKVGAGGLIEQDEKLLLLQRTNDPFREYWNLPAGYAEVDENPIQTAIREVYKETASFIISCISLVLTRYKSLISFALTRILLF